MLLFFFFCSPLSTFGLLVKPQKTTSERLWGSFFEVTMDRCVQTLEFDHGSPIKQQASPLSPTSHIRDFNSQGKPGRLKNAISLMDGSAEWQE